LAETRRELNYIAVIYTLPEKPPMYVTNDPGVHLAGEVTEVII
jgi:hypothetical protein